VNLPSDGPPSSDMIDRPSTPEPSNPWNPPDVRTSILRARRERPAPPRLIVAPDTSWFQLADRDVVRIDTRAPLRRLLGALVDLRIYRPNATMTVIEAFAAGWPGERAHPNAASIRVYTAIHTIRHLGLRQVLVRRNGGYILDADVKLATDETGEPSPFSEEKIAV
jgi:hypothetical protein